ncbi:MAG: glycosyltransferase family 4 protein [Candidatus Rokubacteria bacterium]|nr:glycosyltransferase family 4 protein [Candidatus Rokubacteria bacterium]
MSAPIRLTAVLTHPIQYYAPWWRHIAERCPGINLTVLYGTQPTAVQQGAGFDAVFEWDLPLTEGYPCRVLRAARPGDNMSSDRFWGLDVPEIGAAVRGSRPDVVLLPGWHSITLVRALWASRRAGIPVLYRGDTHLGTRPAGWRGPLWAARTRLLLRRFSGWLAVGQRAHAYLRHFGAPATHVWASPHAVDNDFFAAASRDQRASSRERFGLRDEDFVVLFAGKLEAKKRPLDVVRALAMLRPGAALLMVGGGAIESGLREAAARLGVRVVWAGFVNQSEMPRAYAAADCLALPSDSGDSWGLVVNEALATGLPCVVSDRVGCAPDLVTPGVTGEVVPFGDVTALAGALERVRARLDEGRPYSDACLERAAVYSYDTATAGLEAACRALARPAEDARSPRVLACCGGMVQVAGLERMTFEVLHVLRKRGASVHCVVNTWDNARIAGLAEGIGATWSTGYYWYSFARRARSPLHWIRLGWDVSMTSLGLLRDARRFRPTHVLVPDFVAGLRNAPALAVLRLLGIAVIFRLGNAPDPGAFYRKVWRWGIDPFVDRFVCNSAFTARELLAHGVRPGKVSIIYNCPPRRTAGAAASTERDGGRVIFVGQLIPGKGLDLLLDAVAIVTRRRPEVTLDVVGDLDAWEPTAWHGYHAGLLARAADADLAGRVRFLGHREDVPALMAQAAVHCFPSRPSIREGFGLVSLEAKEAGIPSVVFATGALPEVIEHRHDGWVCGEATAEALAEGLEFFLADRRRREAAGSAARASLERFSREKFAATWWAVFEDPRASGSARGASLAAWTSSVNGERREG